MIVMLHSPASGQGCKSAAAALTCALSGKFNKKTLVLQLTNPKKESIENIMFKKDLDAMMIKALEYEFDDTGIDALMRRASSSSLEKNHFSDVAINLHERTNMMDIIGITKKEDFERETETGLSVVKNLLDQANRIYDIVLVLCPRTKTNLTQKLLEFCDVSVMCVPQSPRYFTPDALPKDMLKQITSLLLVTDYEPESKYTLRNIAHGYGIKTNMVAAIMHDVKYKDAYSSGNIFNFIMRNIGNEPEDDIYSFMKYVIEAAGKVIANETRYYTKSLPMDEVIVPTEELFKPQLTTVEHTTPFVTPVTTEPQVVATDAPVMAEAPAKAPAKKASAKKKTTVKSATATNVEATAETEVPVDAPVKTPAKKAPAKSSVKTAVKESETPAAEEKAKVTKPAAKKAAPVKDSSEKVVSKPTTKPASSKTAKTTGSKTTTKTAGANTTEKKTPAKSTSKTSTTKNVPKGKE